MDNITLKNFNLNNRDIIINFDIVPDTSFDFMKTVNTIIKDDNNIINDNKNVLKNLYNDIKIDFKNYIPDVNIYLDTFGGECYSGFNIYDCIQRLNKHCKVNIIATGKVMSMGIPILLSVPYKQRKATKNTTFMIHQAGSMAMGKCKELEDEAKEVKRITNIIYDIIINNTSITKEQLDTNFEKKEDWIFNADKALELKLISEII